MDPPPFQEASRCDVCKCSFSTFRRRHHCRCCGRTLCAEHSSNQMALPQFDIHSNVRVCADCFNGSRLKNDAPPATPTGIDAVADSFSSLDISKVSDTKPEFTASSSPETISECRCGMPLCICEASVPPSKESVASQLLTTASNPAIRPSTKQKKADPTTKSRVSASEGGQSSPIFNPGQAVSGPFNMASRNYEVTGEGLREAIKNGDAAAAKKLLSQGVDANYHDKQGSSLLHLAAVFNRTEIVFALIDHGASLNSKNSQGETPIDCAPTTLQYKMKKKIEEDMQVEPTE